MNKRSSKKEFLLIIPIIVLVLIMVPLFIPHKEPFFQFAKVSNENYAGNYSVQVYFISWYGCPYGGSDSWGLYIALSNYGQLNVTPNYSDVEAVPLTQNQTVVGAVPGLIFNSFAPKSIVDFHPIYLLNRIYPNGTALLPNGTMIPWSKILSVELNELKKEVPSWVYNLIYEYQIQLPYENGEPIAELGNPPHIASTIIITGPRGTWMLIGYDQQVYYGAPGVLALFARQNPYAPLLLLEMIQQHNIPPGLSFIYEEGVQINDIILKAM